MVSVTGQRARVLIVDDSALIRTLLQRGLENDPDIEVVGSARDGAAALEAYRRLAPDVITLDVEMPGMDGIEVLRRLRGEPVAILLLTAAGDRGCDVAVQGLTLGAFDFLQKPLDGPEGFAALIEELCTKVKMAAFASRRRVPRAQLISQTPQSRPATEARRGTGQGANVSPRPTLRRATGRDAIVVIGASTGGPEALLEVLRTMPEDAPPILIVQHMPDRFTATFARRLDSRLAMRVKEAEDGDHVRHGQVLLAPGSARHMLLRRDAAGFVVRLEDSPAVMHHRPSVDKLFESCAQVAGRRVVAALLTGMGADGARGLLALRRAGAATVAQDEATCVVYGMPMEAVSLGAAAHVLPLGAIGPALLRLSRHGASALDQVG
jgi:two-component system chemotaxis response regulator CheB